MKVGRMMTLKVTTVAPELSLEAAHKLMGRLGVRHLPVVSGRKLAGILSDRDVLLEIGRAQDGSFLYPRRQVGEVMSLAPISAGPDVPLSEIARVMVESKIDALPIVSAQNELLGLVSSTDLLLLLTELPDQAQPGLSYEIRRADELIASA